MTHRISDRGQTGNRCELRAVIQPCNLWISVWQKLKKLMRGPKYNGSTSAISFSARKSSTNSGSSCAFPGVRANPPLRKHAGLSPAKLACFHFKSASNRFGQEFANAREPARIQDFFTGSVIDAKSVAGEVVRRIDQRLIDIHTPIGQRLQNIRKQPNPV